MRTRLMLAWAIVPVLAGCSGDSGGTLSRGGSSPEATFRRIHAACAAGDFATAHRLYSQRLQQVIPVSRIQETYADPEVRRALETLLQGSAFRVERTGLNHAFACVRWSDGSEQKMTFVLEEGEWRLDITPVNPGR